jgi:hypothetical protein
MNYKFFKIHLINIIKNITDASNQLVSIKKAHNSSF